jgi:GT2 family glycosyltransferase
MMDLSVIIISYNVKPFLQRALHTILSALEGIPSEVIVVDNDSGDGSTLMVQEQFPEIHLIKNRENVGFAKANNQAMRLAKGDMICIINPDTLVQDDTFRVCLDYLKMHSDVGAVGCKILNPDGSLQLACRRSIPTPWIAFTKVSGLSTLFPKSKLFGRYNLTYLDPDEISEVEALSGSFMMVRKEILSKAGYLDEIFFLYGEDLDWCYRIQQKGWRIVYLPDTQIIHYKGQSTREAPFDTMRVFYQAMRLFVNKHFQKSWSFFPQWVLIIGIWLRGLLSVLSRCFSRLLIPLIDIGFLQLSLILALQIRFGSITRWNRFLVVNVVYSMVWVACLFVMGLYRKGIFDSSKALEGTVLGFIFNTSLTFFFPQYAFSRKVVIIAGVLNALFLSGWRLITLLVPRIRRISILKRIGNRWGRRRVLIVGSHASGRQFMKSFMEQDGFKPDVVGFLGLSEQDLSSSINGTVPGLGTLKDLDRIAYCHRVHEIILSKKIDNRADLVHILSRGKSHGLHFKVVPENLDVAYGPASMDHLVGIPLVDLDFKIYSEISGFFKRTMDLLFCILLFPMMFPALAYCRISPAFHFLYRCISDGTGGFILIKMISRNQTKPSRWLHILSLYSEVLKGRVSLIGTEIVPFNEDTVEKGFKPGLTGLVQINLYRELDNEEKEQYNLYYLKNYTPLLDIEILFKTITQYISKEKVILGE